MVKKTYDEDKIIQMLNDYLKEKKSKQKPKFETYSIQELLKCCRLYNIFPKSP